MASRAHGNTILRTGSRTAARRAVGSRAHRTRRLGTVQRAREINVVLLAPDLSIEHPEASAARRIDQLVDPARGAGFWVFYREVRREQDYVDFPRTLNGSEPPCPMSATSHSSPRCCSAARTKDGVSVRSGCHRSPRTFDVVAILSAGDPVFHAARIDQP